MNKALSLKGNYLLVRESSIGYTSVKKENSHGKGGDLRSKYSPTLTVVSLSK